MRHLMDAVIPPKFKYCCFVYLDDLCIVSEDIESHLTMLVRLEEQFIRRDGGEIFRFHYWRGADINRPRKDRIYCKLADTKISEINTKIFGFIGMVLQVLCKFLGADDS